MRVSWIWWFQPVSDCIRLQLLWPDRQWEYDRLNRYSQSPMIRSSISSLDLSTLLHCIWRKCNRSILAGWLVQIPASQRGEADMFWCSICKCVGLLYFGHGAGVRGTSTLWPCPLNIKAPLLRLIHELYVVKCMFTHSVLCRRLSFTERNPRVSELNWEKKSIKKRIKIKSNEKEKQLAEHFNLCPNVSVQLQSKEVRDELEQRRNGIQCDDKSGSHCRHCGVKKVTCFESLLQQL